MKLVGQGVSLERIEQMNIAEIAARGNTISKGGPLFRLARVSFDQVALLDETGGQVVTTFKGHGSPISAEIRGQALVVKSGMDAKEVAYPLSKLTLFPSLSASDVSCESSLAKVPSTSVDSRPLSPSQAANDNLQAFRP